MMLVKYSIFCPGYKRGSQSSGNSVMPMVVRERVAPKQEDFVRILRSGQEMMDMSVMDATNTEALKDVKCKA